MKEAFNLNFDVHFLYLFLVLMNYAILIVLYLFFICNCIINVYEYDICIWNMHLKIWLNIVKHYNWLEYYKLKDLFLYI